MRRPRGPAAALAALLLAATPAAAAEAERLTVYDGAVLVDTAQGRSRPDMAVVVQGERIVQVLPSAELDRARLQGAEHVDVRGLYVLPGLIDTHQHLATEPDRAAAEASLRRDVFSGITAVRDMAGDARALADLARAARLGEIPAPDIAYVALMAAPGFFADPRTQASTRGETAGEVPWMQAVTEQTDLRLAVARAAGTGAAGIKIYADLSAPLVRAITQEAHRQGLPVWTHAMVFPATPQEVIGAGVDAVSHACYLAYQVSDPRPARYHGRPPVDYDRLEGDNPVIQALLEEMARRGTVLDATNRVYVEADRRHRADPSGPEPTCTADLAARLTAQAQRAGVEISAGTDGFTPPDAPWPALHEELDILVRDVGMTPAQALRSATVVGARVLGREAEMGTIESGKLANLVFVRDDPLRDIAALRTTVLTVKRGAPYRRADYAVSGGS